MSQNKKPIYKVLFRHQDKMLEIYAHEVSQSSMMAFVEIGDLVFNNHTDVLIDPAEEKLKAEFDGVNRTYIPMHAVVRIDQVDKLGSNKIRNLKGDNGSNVTTFPFPAAPNS